jgi:NAD(P)-dependent dehydrogenase (short-subunit alcohol dehydrogenase family)
MKRDVVVVTGASAGAGRATAQAFGRCGARVGLLARGRDGLEAARREIEASGGEALVLPTDVAQAEQVEAAAAAVEERFGPIDLWINNAMVSVFSPFREMRPDEFRRVTEVTYLGTVYGTMAALRRMLPRDRGGIVQVGSALAYRAIPLQSAYCGAKHAIQGFTESIRSELLHDRSRVRVTMVQLPALNTPQFGWVKSRLPRKPQPVPPIYQPEVAAEAILWASRHWPREYSVNFGTVAVLLGNKLLPGLGDRYLARVGYDAQQHDGAVDPARPHNLWEAIPGDAGAHGDFDDRAWAWTAKLWLSRHRGWLGLGAALLSALLTYRLAGGAAAPARRALARAIQEDPSHHEGHEEHEGFHSNGSNAAARRRIRPSARDLRVNSACRGGVPAEPFLRVLRALRGE